MLAGDPYLASDPELQEASRRAMRLSERYNRTSIDEPDERRRVLEELLGAVGEGVEIRPPFHCDYGSNIRIGARTFANFGLVALDVTPITIGDDVQIGPNVQLLTPTHPVDPEPRRAKVEGGKPITIGDNVWLGGGVIVCPGVTIGENTVVGAGSVVTRDLPPNVVAVGNPARPVKTVTGERLLPETARQMPKARAIELATDAVLAAGKRDTREEVRFHHARTMRRDYGWILLFIGKGFPETGDLLDMHGYEAPVVVFDDGRVQLLEAELPPDAVIASFEGTL